MTLGERLSEYVRAAFSGIWVQSHEHDDALLEMGQLARENGWTLISWDIDRGLGINGQAANPEITPAAADPLSAIKALNSLGIPGGTTILVLRNFHRFLGSAEIVQALDTAVARGKQAGKIVVVLSPVVQVPVELERQFVVVEHDLPGRDPTGADRPLHRHRARRPARGRRPGPGPRCGGGPDPDGGRERLQPVAGPARQGRARDALGTQDGHAQEVGPPDPPPGRRDVRRPGRPRRPEGVHPEGPGRRSSWSGSSGQGCITPRRTGHRQVGPGEGPGQRDRAPDPGPGRRLAHGFLGRPDRGADQAGASGSSMRWPPASCSSTRSRRPSPGSSLRATAASAPGCSGRS